VSLLVAAALTGGEWLGHRVEKCRVLVLDSELTLATILFRLQKVFAAMGVPLAQTGDLYISDLRGRTKDASRALACARDKGPGFYGLIILDPLYTLYPPDPHFSENDNAAMRRLFDSIITFAGETRAAVLAIHHLSKGSQAEKSLTDLGAGAGAIARAGDAHLALRPHRERDCVVFDGVVRDFPEITPSCWRFSFPLYQAAPDLDPTDLAGLKRRKSATEEFLDGKKDTDWTVEDLVARVLTDDGQIIEQVIEAGKCYGQKERAIRGLLKIAIEKRLAFNWWAQGSNQPARFSRKPPPPSPLISPPHPPEARERAPGRGVDAGGERDANAPRGRK
jgi:hypothetical protein